MQKRTIILGTGIAALLLAVGAFLYMKYAMRGFSARAEPSHVEAMLAVYARSTAMPSSAKGTTNPVADSPEVEHDAMAHFADHCAVCHANNGSGDTMFGRGLYPRVPDLRARTQTLTDGEIFYIIENGIRMSGMPAFGGQDLAEDSWKLVRFIRHLPQLTSADAQQMETMNPKTPADMEEEKEEEEFLNGGSSDAAPHTNHSRKGHHQ